MKIRLYYLFLFISIHNLTAATYYLSPLGNDQNDGSMNTPWKTPGYGSRQLIPGDTLFIQSGEYHVSMFDQDIIIPVSGERDKLVTITGDANNRPIIMGSDNLLAFIILDNKSYINIENIEFTSDNGAAIRDGIQIYNGNNHHLKFSNLFIHHIDEFGMDFADIDSVSIENCVISYCGFGAIGGPGGQYGGWRNVTIDHCYLGYSGHYYQGSDGPGPYDRPDGFGIEISDGPVFIRNTLSEHNYGDGLDSKSSNTLIQNCIVANNSCDGIKLWGGNSRVENTLVYGRGDGNETPTPWAAVVIHTEQNNARFEIVNCTIDDYLGQNYLFYAQYDNPDLPIYLTLRNNIFSSRGENAPMFFPDSVHLEMDHNLFYSPNSYTTLILGEKDYSQSQISGIGEGNIYGEPMFTEPAFGLPGDYHLLEMSPAIDAGTANGAPSLDLDGKTRPQGNQIDLGCYEKQPSAHINHITVMNDFHILGNYPNPFNPMTRLEYVLNRTGKLSGYIINIKGQRVKTLINSIVTPGYHSIDWNGLDDQAAQAAAGIYFFVIEFNDSRNMHKILMLR